MSNNHCYFHFRGSAVIRASYCGNLAWYAKQKRGKISPQFFVQNYSTKINNFQIAWKYSKRNLKKGKEIKITDELLGISKYKQTLNYLRIKTKIFIELCKLPEIDVKTVEATFRFLLSNMCSRCLFCSWALKLIVDVNYVSYMKKWNDHCSKKKELKYTQRKKVYKMLNFFFFKQRTKKTILSCVLGFFHICFFFSFNNYATL